MTCHRYENSALVPHTSFRGETNAVGCFLRIGSHALLKRPSGIVMRVLDIKCLKAKRKCFLAQKY